MRNDFPALFGPGYGDGKQMTTLSQMYKQKAKTGSEITTKKTYMVPFDELYLEPGDNIRELNVAWAEHMRDLWIAGADLPALTVTVTDKGVRVDDGQHRLIGAGMAIAAGTDIPRIECKDFVGTELERLAHQAGSNDSLQITPIQRATQYNRARKRGYEIAEIAKAFHRSVSDIESHLQLLSAGPEIIGMVESGEMASTTAVALTREYGPQAGTVATEQMAKAKAAGKKKLTKSAAMQQFSTKKARRLVELMAAFEFTDDGYKAPDEIYLEAMGIIAEYREKNCAPAAASTEGDTLETKLPLLKEDIISQSGVTTWACAAAAFGDKAEFTFSESKYAHTWASDSLENPQIVVVKAETIRTAVELVAGKSRQQELSDWVSSKLCGLPHSDEACLRIEEVYEDYRSEFPSIGDFQNILEKTNCSTWWNIRALRAEVKRVLNELEGASA